jgi:hypothetical protein
MFDTFYPHVALIRTNISEERIASIIRVKRSKLGTMLAVTSNYTIHSSETSDLTRTTWHNIQEDGILHSHRHENLRSYIIFGCSWQDISEVLCHSLPVTSQPLPLFLVGTPVEHLVPCRRSLNCSSDVPA